MKKPTIDLEVSGIFAKITLNDANVVCCQVWDSHRYTIGTADPKDSFALAGIRALSEAIEDNPLFTQQEKRELAQAYLEKARSMPIEAPLRGYGAVSS